MLSSQLCQLELQPWMKSSGVPPPATGPVSSTLTRRPSSSYGRCSARQSTSIQAASSPSAYVSSAPGLRSPLRTAAASCARGDATSDYRINGLS
jgi:hypothetical protein